MRDQIIGATAPYLASEITGTLLSAVVEAVSGDAADVETYKQFSVVIQASSVTTGGTVLLEGRLTSSGEWVTIHTQAINANSVVLKQFNGPFAYIRSSVSSRTDGTYTVTFRAQR